MYNPEVFVSVDRIILFSFFQSEKSWGKRESLQEVRDSPWHDSTIFCLPKAWNVLGKESKLNQEILCLSDMTAAVLLSHTTHGLQPLWLISASLIKLFSSIPTSCKTTISQCLLICVGNSKGKGVSGLSAEEQAHRQKNLFSVIQLCPNHLLTSCTLICCLQAAALH